MHPAAPAVRALWRLQAHVKLSCLSTLQGLVPAGASVRQVWTDTSGKCSPTDAFYDSTIEQVVEAVARLLCDPGLILNLLQYALQPIETLSLRQV